MFISDVSSGLVIGLPIMVTLGPISILLLNQGMDRGARTALPGAVGVASADMTYSSLAALAGTALVAALAPVAPLLRAVGIAVLIWMAWRMARESRSEVAALRSAKSTRSLRSPGVSTDLEPTDAASPRAALQTAAPSAAVTPLPAEFGVAAVEPEQVWLTETSASQTATVARRPRARGAATALRAGSSTVTKPAAPGQGLFAHLGGARLAVAFYGLTLMNPMTIVLMSAVVIAGGPGVGTVGWAAGMTLSSLIAHGGYVLTGSVLRRTCSEMTLARMGTVSAVILVFLSVHLAFT
ncbi:MAG: LysE family transporter [Microthrixaceae bacterium]